MVDMDEVFSQFTIHFFEIKTTNLALATMKGNAFHSCLLASLISIYGNSLDCALNAN